VEQNDLSLSRPSTLHYSSEIHPYVSEFTYICHIGKDGKPSKPFLLPQEDPDKYDYQLYSYNIPELTKGAVEVSPYEIQQVAEKNKPEQVRFK